MFSIIADSLARASGIESEHDARRLEIRQRNWRRDAQPLPDRVKADAKGSSRVKSNASECLPLTCREVTA